MANPTKTKKPSDPSILDSEESTPTQPHAVSGSNASGSAGKARIYRGTQEVDHDLFKLSMAEMRKNVSYTDRPDWQKFEHCHIFHTVDSNGKPQEACSAVGGHFHLVKVINEPGKVPALEISGPKRHMNVKREGVLTKIVADVEGDTHTHDYMYIRSERIALRKTNAEFAQFEAGVRMKREGSVEGVIG